MPNTFTLVKGTTYSYIIRFRDAAHRNMTVFPFDDRIEAGAFPRSRFSYTYTPLDNMRATPFTVLTHRHLR